MAAEVPPYAIQALSHGAALFRQASSSWLAPAWPTTLAPSWSTTGSGSSTNKGGVVNIGDLAVAQNSTPNMSVNVAGGQVWIPGTTSANQGLYYGLNDAVVNLVISASNPTNPRIDFIVATVNDAFYSGSTNNWVLQVLTGTPTAGATLTNLSGVATAPNNTVPLAYVLVPANATSIVTADLLNVQPLLSPGNSGLLQRGTPSGTMAAVAATSTTASVSVQVGSLSAFGGLRGGLAVASNAMTVPIAGKYRVSWQVTYVSTGSSGVAYAGDYQGYVQKNGANFAAASQYAAAGSYPSPGGSIEGDLNAGDVLTLWAYQTSAGFQNVTYAGAGVSGQNTWLSATLVSG